MSDIPMKSAILYTETITTRIDIELKNKINSLRNSGVDMASIIRSAIKKAVSETESVIETNKAS